MSNKKSYHHGNLRAELLNSALDLLRAGGTSADLTLRELARRIGVSQTAPYRHFADKGALLAAVAETGFSALYAKCQESQQKISDPRHRLHQLGVVYVEFALEHPSLFRLMFGAELSPLKKQYPERAAIGQKVYDMLYQATADVMDKSGSRQSQLRVASVAAWSLVHGMAILLLDQHIEVDNADLPALVRAVTTQFADMLH